MSGTLYGDGSDHGQARTTPAVVESDADHAAARAARFRSEVADTTEEHGALVVAQLDRELATHRRDTRTDADRGTEKLTVRVRPGYKARLRALSEHDGWSMGAWVETMIEEAERELREIATRKR